MCWTRNTSFHCPTCSKEDRTITTSHFCDDIPKKGKFGDCRGGVEHKWVYRMGKECDECRIKWKDPKDWAKLASIRHSTGGEKKH
ncbi:unnamed protein product [Fusarium venenatum]|uniref:Uncharacterized protein n=1 Tax=Fusarium venenatum TaxID=56646 RepID=A0A2L2TZC1_9HYPO|nr:uncharacterized protein FVRRES_10583 [Fusarium venenatum]CEI70506.1 unnamed protein product [Fusarium venenatum]